MENIVMIVVLSVVAVVTMYFVNRRIDAIIDRAVEEAVKAVMELKGGTDVSRQESEAFTMGIAEGRRCACDEMLGFIGEIPDNAIYNDAYSYGWGAACKTFRDVVLELKGGEQK